MQHRASLSTLGFGLVFDTLFFSKLQTMCSLFLLDSVVAGQATDFFSTLFGFSDWPARWHCGKWSSFHGWLYIISDLVIWVSYFALPLGIAFFVGRRKDVPFPRVFYIFGAFILLCGLTHLIDVVIFWLPLYRVSALLRFFTAIVSVMAAIAFFKILPVAFSLKSSTELEKEISERKKAEEQVQELNRQLREQNEALESNNKQLESFSYSLSHDLKGPARRVTFLSEMILNDYANMLPTDVKDLLLLIRNNSRNSHALVEDLMHFFEIGRKSRTLTWEMIDMNTLVSSVLEEMSVENPSLSGLFTLKDLPELSADKPLLKQVIINLAGNAVKYSSKSTDPRIEIGPVDENGQKGVYIRDNGIGFDQALTSTLFKPFSRLHSDSSYEGTGIGLAIVQSIIGKHGGRVGANSEPGKGAIFYFTLPSRP